MKEDSGVGEPESSRLVRLEVFIGSVSFPLSVLDKIHGELSVA